MAPQMVTLGEHEIPVLAQPHAYLANRLGRFIADLVDDETTDLSGEGLAGFFGDKTYDALVALIPTLKKRMPEYEFRGYASAEAMAAGEFDEQAALKTPTFPQIVEAFEVAVRVNRFDLLKHLLRFIDPNPIRAAITLRIAETISGTSLSSPPMNGESDQTSSGTTDRTSGESAD